MTMQSSWGLKKIIHGKHETDASEWKDGTKAETALAEGTL